MSTTPDSDPPVAGGLAEVIANLRAANIALSRQVADESARAEALAELNREQAAELELLRDAPPLPSAAHLVDKRLRCASPAAPGLSGLNAPISASPETDHRQIVLAMASPPGKVKLTDMTLEEEVQRRVYMDVLLPMQHPHLFNKAQSAEKGLLLYGPPGCGKTMLVGGAVPGYDEHLVSSRPILGQGHRQ
jgi:DNA replication protein DnaC